MSLPRYPEYKDSGVAWLGEVPAHWGVRRLKLNLALLTEKATRRDWPVALENIEGWSGRFLPTEGEFEGDGVAFDAGDILFGKLRPYLAKVFLAERAGEAVGDFHVLRPKQGMDGRYVQYQMLSQSFIDAIDGSTFGSKMPRASWETLGHMPLTVPPAREQTAITAFLDRETAKIDALITEQEKLIALLAEKRQATISHAVIKGLDPNTPMKDSGVPWLGEVPAHWRMLRVKAVSQFTTSGPRGWSERITEDGSLFIQSGDLNNTLGIDFEAAKRVSVADDAEAARTRLIDGDVVVCITGAKTGNVAVCAQLREPAYVNQHLCLIRPTEDVLPLFLASTLKSNFGQTQFELSQYGLKQGLSLENIRELWIAVPPRHEQTEIIGFLSAETIMLEELKAQSEHAIALLKERRSALIAAAVTGKIDVSCQVENIAI
ncbi:restriction endonuclease subunit S [Xanthomonas sp. AmX2]|uniref:restriction endonuclease subunit S n=1 Tax=Xanthomonas sp. TaxID=29446 RepID=UPI00197CFD61|nr:restriction endonuclease subunit S [Xanthomonas sp.]MBN6149352.1 restriction endonuclease subunit S [Xanthomonas sp.]